MPQRQCPSCHMVSGVTWYEHWLHGWGAVCFSTAVPISLSVTSHTDARSRGWAMKEFIVIFKTSTIISNFLEGCFKTMQIPCFSLKFHPLILLFTRGPVHEIHPLGAGRGSLAGPAPSLIQHPSGDVMASSQSGPLAPKRSPTCLPDHT